MYTSLVLKGFAADMVIWIHVLYKNTCLQDCFKWRLTALGVFISLVLPCYSNRMQAKKNYNFNFHVIFW